MFVTYIILIIISGMMILGHFAMVNNINKSNETRPAFLQLQVKQSSMIRFYVAILVFAIACGLLVEYSL